MPIACSLYDQLEVCAMQKDKVRLTFMLDNQNKSEVIAQIGKLYVKEGREYLLTTDGQEYSLDALINVERCTV
jgi:transcriptional antiterminator Rof (Rho-off)